MKCPFLFPAQIQYNVDILGRREENHMSNWIAEDAVIFGDIRFKDNCSVFYHTVIRTEYEPFMIGECTNIQDNCVIHGDKGYPVIIGDYVTIGHACVIHGCTIGDNTLIGMGSIIMNGAKIGNNCIIGAGSLISENTVIPDNSVAFGRPAKVKRTVREEEIENIRNSALHYLQIKQLHEQ